jgi:hypothetical protein
MGVPNFHDGDLVDRLNYARKYESVPVGDALLQAIDEITRLRQRVRDLDQALSDAEHRLTWGHH